MLKKLFTLLLFASLVYLPAGLPARAAPWVHIELSHYYALPNQSIRITGYDFAPNELVTIHIFNVAHQAKANSKGQFGTATITVPFTYINTRVPITAEGAASGTHTAELVVGSFYPHVEPNTYFTRPGNKIIFRGRDFAPNEPITVSNGGVAVANTRANSSGGFSGLTVSTHSFPGALTYTISGDYSGTRSMVTLRLDPVAQK